MSLWRLEWLRLVRTRRLLALVGVFAFFGLTGPLLARYTKELLKRFGGGVTVNAPPPTPADGIAQFMANGQQLGLLAVVLVAAACLAFDGQRESAVFLRSRVRRVADLIVPKVVVTAAATGIAFVLGVGLAWYETAVLLGRLPAGRVLLGTALELLYLAFVLAVVAGAAGVTRGVAASALTTLAVLVLLGIAGSLGAVGRWLPSHLVGSLSDLARHGRPGDYLASFLVTLALIPLVLAWSIHRLTRRDV